MTKLSHTRPSPATVVACVALSFALAGSAAAGTDGVTRAVSKSKVKTIAKKQAGKVLAQREASLNVNSAKTADTATTAGTATKVAANGVDTAALQDDAVNSAKVANESLDKADVANNAIGDAETLLNVSDEIVDNSVGGQDLAAFAVTQDSNAVNDVTASDGNWTSGSVTASCPASTTRVSGGGAWGGSGAENLKRLSNSFPSGSNDWQVTGAHDTGLNLSVFAYVICISG